MESATLDVSDTPPSLNAVGLYQHWRQVHRAKQRWQNDLGMLLLAESVPKELAVVRAHAVLRFPQRRRRDEGNFRALLEKALGDALVGGGWLADDTPERYRFGAVKFDSERGPRRTLVTIEYER